MVLVTIKYNVARLDPIEWPLTDVLTGGRSAGWNGYLYDTIPEDLSINVIEALLRRHGHEVLYSGPEPTSGYYRLLPGDKRDQWKAVHSETGLIAFIGSRSHCDGWLSDCSEKYKLETPGGFTV